MTQVIELYSKKPKSGSDVEINWGDGTIEKLSAIAIIDPNSLADDGDKKTLEGSSGLICYNYAS